MTTTTRRARARMLGAVLAIAAVAVSAPADAGRPVFPDVIALPDGWLPEGIAIGPGPTFYAGSRADGAVYRGDLRTGAGEIFVTGQAGRVAVGLEYDARCGLLLVAGGPTGDAYAHDARTGTEVGVMELTAEPSFVNDVAVARRVAYFTDSQQGVLHRVGLADCDAPGPVDTITLGGDWTQVPGFNANGIVADPAGRRLLVVNSTTGGLFSVDPATGTATVIEAPPVPAGDGLLLHGRTLYVVQNRLNQIAVIELDRDWLTGRLTEVLTDADLDVPTTIARFGDALYAVNGRFTTPPTPTTPYQIVRVTP